MEINKILVIGGNGMLGIPVAKQLLKDNYEVSILTRDPDSAKFKLGDSFNYLGGDVTDIDAINKIFASNKFDGIHINLNAQNYVELEEVEVEGTTNIVNAARNSNIKKITIISGAGVHERNAWSPFIKFKLEIENIVKSSGIPYTIFNCTHFLEGISKYIRKGKISIMGKQPHPASWVAASDYAEMVSNSYSIEKSNNKHISVLGPQKITMKEVFQKYIDTVDSTLKLVEVPLWTIKLIAFITFNSPLKYVIDLLTYFDKVPEKPIEGTITDILGKPSKTADEWMKAKRKSRDASLSN